MTQLTRTILCLVMTVILMIAFIVSDYLKLGAGVLVGIGFLLSGIATFISMFKED